MDARYFDLFARALATHPEPPTSDPPGGHDATTTRRRLLGIGARVAAPLAGITAALLAPQFDAALAKDRRRRRKQRHRRRKDHGKRQHGCTPKSNGKICDGRCGTITSRKSCGKPVDCGVCTCDPACVAGQTCCERSLCLDLQTDATNCGACGNVCGGGLTCCNGACIDLQTDHANCGACGNACGDGLCRTGVCHACDVTCDDTPAACGIALQTAFRSHATTLYVCPGIYAGGFSILRNQTIIGAGAGDDPATATILDGGNTRRVLFTPDFDSLTISLVGLRITRGYVDGAFGAGLHNNHSATVLTLRDCVIDQNHAVNVAGEANGGGIYAVGPLTLIDCLLEGNSAGSTGGAIYSRKAVQLSGATTLRGNSAAWGGGIYCDGPSLQIGEHVRITGNSAAEAQGGGIWNNTCTVNLDGPDPSPIITDNCHENCAGNSAVARCQPGGICAP